MPAIQPAAVVRWVELASASIPHATGTAYRTRRVLAEIEGEQDMVVGPWQLYSFVDGGRGTRTERAG